MTSPSEAERLETESTKYNGAIVLPLSSGAVALLDNRRQLIGVYSDNLALWAAISAFHPWREPPRAKPAPINLEDLGL